MSKQDEVQENRHKRAENAEWAIKKGQRYSKERRTNLFLQGPEVGGKTRNCQG